MRRAIPALLAVLALAAAGCGGTPGSAAQQRIDFLDKTKSLDDQELAKLCPALYPRDFLSEKSPDGADKYKYKRDKSPADGSTEQATAAKGIDCGTSSSDGTTPKK